MSSDQINHEHSVAVVSEDAGPMPVFDAPEILRAVERVRTSRTMISCPRLVQFLNFIVNSTLNGDAAQLKETTIGVAVFGRSPDYDPKVDTIVRSQAWRLRAKLKKYYETEGASESLIIDVPSGHYIPVFRSRESVMPHE